jgi:proline iminopeptidase
MVSMNKPRRCEAPYLTRARATPVLSGGREWTCLPLLSEEMHELIPDSDLCVFEESGHSIGGDEPHAFFDAVAGFLAYRRPKGERLA